MDGPDYREIEWRIKNSQEPTLALDLSRPACVSSRSAGGRLSKRGSVCLRVYQPVFAGGEIGRTNNRATGTARFVDTG